MNSGIYDGQRRKVRRLQRPPARRARERRSRNQPRAGYKLEKPSSGLTGAEEPINLEDRSILSYRGRRRYALTVNDYITGIKLYGCKCYTE
ncbi:hypothetical protein KOW79_017709 [Hemibagrus wyckioides]|uniref:Uncharacterized protein n=1 Tax=Hemibagrus wyckioides TaxID=337641 RepID=A0A9D3SD26_9TELE|nr:hypothetical protein KOW79_017709 [Hemibagrus wyckioides]